MEGGGGGERCLAPAKRAFEHIHSPSPRPLPRMARNPHTHLPPFISVESAWTAREAGEGRGRESRQEGPVFGPLDAWLVCQRSLAPHSVSFDWCPSPTAGGHRAASQPQGKGEGEMGGGGRQAGGVGRAEAMAWLAVSHYSERGQPREIGGGASFALLSSFRRRRWRGLPWRWPPAAPGSSGDPTVPPPLSLSPSFRARELLVNENPPDPRWMRMPRIGEGLRSARASASS